MRGGRAFRACLIAAASAAAWSAAAFAQNDEEEAPPPTPEQLYQQALDEGAWVNSQSLTVADLAYSFALNINGKDDRESAAISAWYGIYQTGGLATVMFSVSGMDVVFSDDFTEEHSATCRHLNDGRWWCEADISSLKIDAAFYLEQAPVGEAEDAVAGTPVTPPPR